MSTLGSGQFANDKCQQQPTSDQTASPPLVDMTNQNDVQSAFKTASREDSNTAASGQIEFSNPFSDSHCGAGDQHHGQGDHRRHGHQGQTDQHQPTDSGTALEQQLQTQIEQLTKQIQKLTTEFEQQFGDSAGRTTNSTDTTTPATTGDNSTTTPAGSTDTTSTTPATTGDNGTTTPTGSTDTTATTPATTGDNGTSSSSTTDPGAKGTYHVEGNQIIGPDGKPFIMTGINDTSSTEHNELTGSLGALAADGANTIRLMGTAADLEGGPDNAFNQEVKAALDAGMFVDISAMSDASMYGATGGVYSADETAQAAQALRTSAALYANNPNVGFNVANEQGASGDANNAQLLSNTETLLAAVNEGARSVNPNANPIKFVDDSEWGQAAFAPNYQSQSFIYNNVDALKSYGNVVAAIHNYESTPGTYNTAGLNAIQDKGMPVIAEEVGVQDPAIAADTFNTLSQPQSTTGKPIGGLVWVDGTAPNGSFYNNVMNTDRAPAVRNFWRTIDDQSAVF